MLEIGLCAEEITPGESVPLFGYGDRTHDSEGIHDPLYACAWWLRPQGGEPFLWLVLDLCVLSPGAARAVADGVRQSLGEPALSAERVVVSTTHTHSGPDTWDIARDNRPWARRNAFSACPSVSLVSPV